MSNLLTRILIWFILIVVFVTLLVSIQANVLADDASYEALEAVFSFFPFAELTAKAITTIFKFQVALNVTSCDVITDLTKLLAMTMVCPGIIGFAMRFLLPLPSGNNWQQNERHMKSFSYRLQETLLYILGMPICAVLTFFLVQFLQRELTLIFPFLPTVFVSFLLLGVVFLLSIIYPVLYHNFNFFFLLRHRLVNDLFGNLINILLINAFCFLIVLCMLNDQQNLILYAVVGLYISLFGISLMIDAVTGALA